MSSKKPILNQRYQVERKLGKGAMGEVFLAADLQQNELVAIKTISEELYRDEDVRKRFTREVTALRKLNHPNIISYVDTFMVSNRACLVMEYVGGGTLADFIEQHDLLEEGLFKKIAAALVDAMATAHEAGIIHRDLKPANIMLTAALEPKIADFGLARLSDASTMTSTGIAMGTLAYMAPEAFDPLSKGDHRSDIWALGVIFFEMLTGNLPFLGTTQPQIINAILNEPPEFLQRYRRDVSPYWGDMIARCLAKKPHERYQTTRDILHDLNEVPRAIRTVDDSSSALGSSFAFRFIDVTVEDQIVPKLELANPGDLGQTMPDVAMQVPPRGAAPRYQLRASKEKTPPLASMLIGGAFAWLGILFSFAGALFSVLRVTAYGEKLDVSQSTSETSLVLGALLFIIGLLFEAVYLNRERWLELGILIIATGAIWAIFFSGFLLPASFFFLLVGTMFYLVALMAYLQLQRT